MTDLPVLTQEQYRELRADGGLSAWCDRCGRCEPAGGFCSWCSTHDYVLTIHAHPKHGRACDSTTVRGSIVGTYHHPGVDDLP